MQNIIPVACTIEHYKFLMYTIRSKLLCLSDLVEAIVDSNKTLAYHEICPLTVHDEYVMFYSTGPRLARIARDKHCSLFCLLVIERKKGFIKLTLFSFEV
jgi:hypothetical protein